MTINWNDSSTAGTALAGYLTDAPWPWTFEETVARLITASGQDPTEASDGYKVSVEFVGTADGRTFTLYDYKCDRTLHIGTRGDVLVPALRDAIRAALDGVAPTRYVALEHYDRATSHAWPVKEVAR